MLRGSSLHADVNSNSQNTLITTLTLPCWGWAHPRPYQCRLTDPGPWFFAFGFQKTPFDAYLANPFHQIYCTWKVSLSRDSAFLHHSHLEFLLGQVLTIGIYLRPETDGTRDRWSSYVKIRLQRNPSILWGQLQCDWMLASGVVHSFYFFPV